MKDLLGATATLEYRLVHGDPGQAFEAESSGRAPAGAALYHERNGQPILLKRQVIVTGDEMTSASSGFDQQSGQPAVYVNLDSKGAPAGCATLRPRTSVKPMAVVFKEKRTVGRDAEGKPIRKWVEEVINVATIREAFGRRFQTTGLDSAQEAHQLAFAAAGRRTGRTDQHRRGAHHRPEPGSGQHRPGHGVGRGGPASGHGRDGGLLQGVRHGCQPALIANLVLIVAILSMLQATLTVPGIAGIVLTVGMAVDANVLIYERIREELSIGSTPQASIHAGYERAFSSILTPTSPP